MSRFLPATVSIFQKHLLGAWGHLFPAMFHTFPDEDNASRGPVPALQFRRKAATCFSQVLLQEFRLRQALLRGAGGNPRGALVVAHHENLSDHCLTHITWVFFSSVLLLKIQTSQFFQG